MVLGQPTGLSKEACFNAVADWLRLACQSESGERSMVCSVYFRIQRMRAVD